MTLFFKTMKDAILSMKGQAMHQLWDDALDAAMNKMDELMDLRVKEANKRGMEVRETEHIKVSWKQDDTDGEIAMLTVTVKIPNGSTIGLQSAFGPERYQKVNMEIELLEIMYCTIMGIAI